MTAIDVIEVANSYTWLWDDWLHESVTTASCIRELRRWFTDNPTVPFHLPRWIRVDRAQRLHEVFETETVWARTCGVADADDRVTIVSELEAERTAARRWFLHDLAVGLRDDGDDEVSRFLSFAVTSPLLASWVSLLAGRRVSIRTCEVVRYRRGDFIVPHKDTHDDRIIALNVYLDRDWTPVDGGVLAVRSPGGVVETEPRFSSAVLLPIGAQLEHWVGAWQADRAGRHTISLSFEATR